VSLAKRQLSLFSGVNGEPIDPSATRIERRVTYDRSRLYAEVWSAPARSIAQRYGVSDVALAKMCRKLSVPLPGRGYWAKVVAGHNPPRRELPRLCSAAYDQVTVTYLAIGERRITRMRIEPSRMGEQSN
jgi:hypothetical protein